MTKFAMAAAAVLFSVSTLAIAQTTQTSPSTMPSTPPSSGSSTAPGGGSGSSAPSASISSEEIKEALEQRGFSNVQVRPSTNGHSVTAMKDGNQVRLEVDPTGRVMQAR